MKKDNEGLNILVTGANGQLGKSIRKASENSKDNYIFTDVEDLDITKKADIDKWVKDNDIDIIINCAAYTNVDAAEDHKELAEKLNGMAPGLLAQAIGEHNGLLIHISTDYVFGGSGVNTPLTETQATNPTGVYGATKLQGEQEIAKSGTPAIIIRTAWLYSDYGNNFVEKILSLLGNRDEIKVVFDQCGTPTYATDLAEAIVGLITDRKFMGNEGIYHFSNEGVCSWYDFALEASKIKGLKGKRISPCHSSEFPSKVIRPPYSVLDKTKFKNTFRKNIPHWRESLERALNK
ncbi:MAG: dTDP-4-dehydrorhamnose reductase [Muribaculaceae bacterium]|nr:dTDP-4-dehydrorhamnose reductase [Muribaculaceae bacterium]